MRIPLSLLFLVLSAPTVIAAAPAPTGLMCNLLAVPDRTLITTPQPRFSWILNSNLREDIQSAYQVRLANTASALDQLNISLWDSGKVLSDQSTEVIYAGKPLESNHSYCWKVRTWNRQGAASGWSVPQQFRTGLLRPTLPGSAAGEERITVARYPLEQQEIAPASIAEISTGHYFIDFGRAAFGALKLTLSSPQAGQKVLIGMGEALEGPRQVNRHPGGSVRYHQAELILQEGTHSYAVPLEERDSRRMPPEIGPVMPFRYVEIENSPSALDKSTVRQAAVHYSFNDRAATFVSSNQDLNHIWDLCHYTMKATSFCGVYVDGDRERLPYEADAYINQLGQYCCDREYTLARYSHEYLLLHPTWPTEWILHSVLIAWADYIYTGDSSSLAEFYQDLKARTLYQLARSDGLISTTQPPVSKELLSSLHTRRIQDIVDWPPGERDGYDLRPVNTVVNAFHYRAMLLMSRIAGVMQKPQDEKFFRDGAARVYESFNRQFYNPETGLYVDGEGSRHSSLHANMFALAFGLVPLDRVPRAAAFIRSKGMSCSVYGAQYLLEALYQAGEADYAIALMTAKNDRSWSHMINDVGTTITTEAWDSKYKPNQDWNHAWGAAPANIIPRLLMGIQPLAPGFRKIQIHPQPGSLAHAAMDLPTIRGTVHVHFHSSPHRFLLHVQLPANTTAQVYLPQLNSGNTMVRVDGSPRPGRLDGKFIVLDPIGSGTHQLERLTP